MGKFLGIALIAGAAVLAVIVGQRMSTDAMAVVVGVVFGVAASIPTSLLVVAATRSRRDEGYRAPREELRPPPQVIVVQQPVAQAPQIVAPLELRRWGEMERSEDAVWTMVGEE